ncbi:metal-dependent protein hydrolase [Westerdykella ornata]|uniref:Metal-dependent protein hydrolase n=1 Tax=Westerdykella ornata TaxID=318751 RepID=A0A6A6JG45_WESOR|nr:metal-dependent protein hydrolase [Westerdykella ornata]KAF2275123.1 metal-dependent protein hydrolase [Westerdykella ornata]
MSAVNPAKKMKLDGPLIGTHNGHFHADEALAVSMLRLLPTYASSPLVRTRDPAVLANCHTVVDVGAEYDPSKNRFDHHQREFTTTFPGHNIKLSSAGLVYLHFGKDIIQAVTGIPPGEDLDLLFEKIYNDFIEAFDANDNGVNVLAPKDLEAAGLTKKFEDRGFTIASIVNRYNYTHSSSEAKGTKEEQQALEDARFAKASAFLGEQFVLELTDRAAAWLPARKEVAAAYAERLQYDPQGRILVLKKGMPWADHLYTLEKEAHIPEGVAPQVLYVLFPETDEADSKWRIRAVSKENSGFENRKDLPDAWKGVRDEELSRISGIPGGVFVHAAGFIGGNKTFEGALAMAQKALEL